MKIKLTVIAILGLVLLGTACNKSSDTPVDLGPRTRSSAALVQFNGCDTLLAKLRSSYGDELKTNILQYESMLKDPSHGWWGPMYSGGVLVDAAVPGANGATGASAPRQEGTSYSGTNNQEAGVDEADFVKTDGFSIFLIDGQKLVILGVPEIGGITTQGSLDIEGWPTQMLMDGNRVVVFSSVYTWNMDATNPLAPYLGRNYETGYGWWYRVSSLTKMTVVDVTDRAAPTVLRELYLEGWMNAARKVQDTVRMVNYAYVYIPGIYTWIDLPSDFWSLAFDDPQRSVILHQAALDTIAKNDAVLAQTQLSAFVPLMLVRDAGGELTEYDFTNEACANFSMASDAVSHGFTSILTLGLGDPLTVEADHIVSNWSTVYASTDTLVLAEPAQDWWWYWGNADYDEATNLHRFDISTPGVTTYTGSGRIDGTVASSFSLSEADGYLRVASTTGQWGRWWLQNPPPPDNHVFVLSGADALTVVGQLDGIATGERLWSTRFVGDKAFLVSFKSIDPLWTVDLSNPTQPALVGELQVPGVSTYIHPLAGDHLLTIGYGASDDTLIEWGSTQVSLFDVTNFASPALDDALNFAPKPSTDGWSGSYSQATWDHHAFDYWAPLGMLAVPLSSWRYYPTMCPDTVPGGTVGYTCWGYQYLSTLELVKVDTTAGTLVRYGSLDQSDFYNSDPYTWWWNTEISRSIFMHDDTLGDFVYAISDRAVTVHQITDGLPRVGSVSLPGTPNYWYYGVTN